MKNAATLLPIATQRLNTPPLCRKVIHVDATRDNPLTTRNNGRYVTNTADNPALPKPASDSAVGMTQQGLVKNPASAANNALLNTDVIKFAPASGRSQTVLGAAYAALRARHDQPNS